MSFKPVHLFDSPIKILGASIIVVEGLLGSLILLDKIGESLRGYIVIGMIVVLVLTIIAAVLIHWIDKKTLVPVSTTMQNAHELSHDIFLAYPIAATENDVLRNEIGSLVNEVTNTLSNIGVKNIFDAANQFKNDKDYEPPEIACKKDLNAIRSCRNFFFLFPAKLPSSAIMELGFALALNKRIAICTTSKDNLPFLLKGLSECFDHVNYIEYKNADHLKTIIKENFDYYFLRE